MTKRDYPPRRVMVGRLGGKGVEKDASPAFAERGRDGCDGPSLNDQRRIRAAIVVPTGHQITARAA